MIWNPYSNQTLFYENLLVSTKLINDKWFKWRFEPFPPQTLNYCSKFQVEGGSRRVATTISRLATKRFKRGISCQHLVRELLSSPIPYKQGKSSDRKYQQKMNNDGSVQQQLECACTWLLRRRPRCRWWGWEKCRENNTITHFTRPTDKPVDTEVPSSWWLTELEIDLAIGVKL